MIVLVVSSGLVVFGCDAVFVRCVSVEAGAQRLASDAHWVRDSPSITHLRFNRCDDVDVMILSYASDQENPAREVLSVRSPAFRPGDINLDGVQDSSDVAAYLSQVYDYNMDGIVNATDYFDLLNNIFSTNLCE